MAFCPSPLRPRSCVGWLLLLPFLAAAGGAAGAADLAPGFRQIEGQHLTLITDLPASAEVDDLPRAFDAAFPQWCDYFGVDPKLHADWHVTGYLMKNKERFQQAGYWRDDLPPFPNGYSTGDSFWLYTQSSNYYRRHLLLHEGVHSFMYLMLGSLGPSWYIEGIAELLGTHRWRDGQIEVGYFPHNDREVLQLGRIKIIQEAVEAGKPLSLGEVLRFDGKAHLKIEAYAWSWALAAFLDGHPRYRERFRQAAELVRDGDFEARFHKLFAADWHDLEVEWQVFVANLDYAYDFQRMVIDFRPGKPLVKGRAQCSLAADRGWQSSGIYLEAGHKYELRARGRYQVGQQPATWWCEPGGVTLRYEQGQPLGVLLAAVHPDRPAAETAADAEQPDEKGPSPQPAAATEPGPDFAHPIVVGLAAEVNPAQSGTLYLRINESAAGLADNAGTLQVDVRQVD